MPPFDQLNREYESAQWAGYERRMYEADLEDWLAGMTDEERRDYERRQEEREVY